VAGVEKTRLDVALCARQTDVSREAAKAYIMAGQVYVNGQRELKAGRAVAATDAIELRRDNLLPFVSRGGGKLERAVEFFDISLQDAVCMDVGSSTGGFTDCMLSHGAAQVYAIDVGYGQLAYTLRTNPRVVCLERTNFRYLTATQVPQPTDFAGVDVSFISLRLIFPTLYAFLTSHGHAVCLIKPQFEAGKERVGKKGVVREPAVHEDVIRAAIANARQTGFFVRGLTFSPLKGPEGNIEFLLWIAKTTDPVFAEDAFDVADTVRQAWATLF
jgi:23S rRNA (cytidine1920-2'-O)/16S rRNA (cytidine1409-2'-O)-methyltransferase